MTGLPGLPARDRTLLPKPCTDLWPDSAPEMGVALEGVVVGQAPGLTPGARVVGQGPTGTSHTVGGVGGEGIWFCYLAMFPPPTSFLTVKSHLDL